MLVRLTPVFVAIAFTSALIAQQQSPFLSNQSMRSQSAAAPVPQEQFVPYWTAEPGWHTELMLRNNLASEDLLVTPNLRLTDGSEVTLPAVSVAASTVQSVNLHDALMQSHPEVMDLADPYGSVAVRYNSLYESNLYASVMIHYDGHPILFHLDGVYRMPSYARGSREGVWWLPQETTNGYLILTNLSETEQDGILWLYAAAGTPWKQSISLPPKQSTRLSIRELVTRSGLSGDHGGVSLQMPQGAGSVSSALLLYDKPSGFSANMKMFDWDPAATLKSRYFAQTGK